MNESECLFLVIWGSLTFLFRHMYDMAASLLMLYVEFCITRTLIEGGKMICIYLYKLDILKNRRIEEYLSSLKCTDFK